MSRDLFAEWAASDDPVKRRHVEALRARKAGEPASGFPSLTTQAANLAGAAVRFAASGGKMVTPEERERRLAICHECPHFSGSKCRLCGCVARWKARLASESCPDKPPRW